MEMPRVSGKERLILELLSRGRELYGLEMVAASKGDLKRGTVYVTLDRMQDKGFVESREEPAPGQPGPARRMYRITGVGTRALATLELAQAAWEGGLA